jgi:hypothetical protein
VLLIDDVLLFPARGLIFVFNELAKKAREELLDDGAVKHELRETYMLLETGRISEQEFDRRERRLVRRLEEIDRMRAETR